MIGRRVRGISAYVSVHEGVSAYRKIFEKYYPGQGGMIPGFWMPNREWEGCDVDDPSARVLKNYGDSGKYPIFAHRKISHFVL